MFFVNWYFVWETFFWNFLQLKWQQPWAFFHTLFSSFSTLCFFFSFSFWRVEFFTKFCLSISQIIVSVLPVSIVDRASIWKIWSLTWFQCIHYYILRYQMLWQDSRNKTWLICINMSYLLDKSMKRRTLSNKHVFLRTEQDMNCTS